MRKLSACLIAAVLSAAPVAAADPWGHVETFEWSASSQGARLGVMVMSMTPELRTYFGAPNAKGVLVAKVEPDSAAAKAGVKVGDVLVQVKSNAVDEASDVIRALAESKPGDSIRVEIVRDKKPLALDVTMASGTSTVSEQPEWLRRVFPWFESLPRASKST